MLKPIDDIQFNLLSSAVFCAVSALWLLTTDLSARSQYLATLSPDHIPAGYHGWADTVEEADGIFLDWSQGQWHEDSRDLLKMARKWLDDNEEKAGVVQIQHIVAGGELVYPLWGGRFATYLGTRLTEVLYDARTENVLKVENSSRFRMKQSPHLPIPDQILIMSSAPDGSPDPGRVELVELAGIDGGAHELTVRRAAEPERRSLWEDGSWVLPVVQLRGNAANGAWIYHPTSEAGFEAALNHHLQILRSEDNAIQWDRVVLKHVQDVFAINNMIRQIGRHTDWNADGEADTPEEREQAVLDFSARLIGKLQEESEQDLTILADTEADPAGSFELIEPDGLYLNRTAPLVKTAYANLSSWLSVLRPGDGEEGSSLIEAYDSWSLGLALITGNDLQLGTWPHRRFQTVLFGPDGDEPDWMGDPKEEAHWMPMEPVEQEPPGAGPRQWIQASSGITVGKAGMKLQQSPDGQPGRALVTGVRAAGGHTGLVIDSRGGKGILTLSIRPEDRPLGETPLRAGLLTEEGRVMVSSEDSRYPVEYFLAPQKVRQGSTDAYEALSLWWRPLWLAQGTFADYVIRVPTEKTELHYELLGPAGEAQIAFLISRDGEQFKEIDVRTIPAGKVPVQIDLSEVAGEAVYLRLEMRKTEATSTALLAQLYGLHFTEPGGNPAYRWTSGQRLTRNLSFLKSSGAQTMKAYIRWGGDEPLALTFGWSGNDPLIVELPETFFCSGVIGREFEEALVLLNGSGHERVVDLEDWKTGEDWVWLEGDEAGKKIGEPVRIRPLESLVLVRD